MTFVAYHPHMMTLKLSSTSPICSSKSLKFRNYGKAPYIFSPYIQPLHQVIHLMLAIQTNSPHHHQNNNKHLLNLLSPRAWPILKVKSIRIMKCRSILKIFKKRLYMKPPVPEAFCAKGFFQIQPLISGIDFSNKISIPQITLNNLWNLLTS